MTALSTGWSRPSRIWHLLKNARKKDAFHDRLQDVPLYIVSVLWMQRLLHRRSLDNSDDLLRTGGWNEPFECKRTDARRILVSQAVTKRGYREKIGRLVLMMRGKTRILRFLHKTTIFTYRLSKSLCVIIPTNNVMTSLQNCWYIVNGF